MRNGTLRPIGNMQMLSEAYSTCPMHKQCISLPSVHHHICHTKRVPKNLYFVYNLRVNHGEKWQIEAHMWLSDAKRNSSNHGWAHT